MHKHPRREATVTSADVVVSEQPVTARPAVAGAT